MTRHRSLLSVLVITFGVSWVVGCNGGPPGTPEPHTKLSASVLEQLRLLREEKSALTPAQRKMSTELVLAVKRRQDQAFLSALPDLRTGLAFSRSADVLVDIKATVDPLLLELIVSQGGRITASVPRFNAVQARVPVDALETLAAAPQVRSIREALGYFTRKDNTSAGDVAHSAGIARTLRGISGAGVTIGVISDGVNTMAARQATGDLPASPQLQVLPGQAGTGDEGTAMLEIVHDLAPGANLLFATCDPSAAQMAQNILDLHTAGAKVIVDDIGYIAEGAFQDDVIAQAVDTVTAAGAIYLSAAGNGGNKNDGTSGTYEGDYLAMPDPTVFGYPDVHNFGGGLAYDTITLDGAQDRTHYVTLQWSDPMDGSSNDYDLVLMNSSLTSLYGYSAYIQDGTQDPLEAISSIDVNHQGLVLVIARYGGDARYLRLVAHPSGRLAVNTNGNTWGHAAAENALGVAAVDVATAGGGAFVGGATNPVETFSSDGPRRIFYAADGTPITPGNFSSTGGVSRPKPELAAADGVATATPGFNPFYGTSAAAPHAAAIVGLLLEQRPDIAALTDASATAEVRALLATSHDIEAPGIDQDSGSGIIMADAITTPACGDATVGAGEDCDEGIANGTAGSCCTASCTFKSSGTTCRAAAGACDVAETCTGTSGACPADGFQSSATECRQSAGACDVAEHCTGSSASCPADGFQSSATECRAAAGACDVAEYCTGTGASCPADGFQSSATVCRTAVDVCDVAESCTGASAGCPADGFQSSATVCRQSAGACDVAESCTGTSASCPADGFQSSATVCRQSAGACDVAESCTGASVSCPADGFQSSATVCRTAAGECDVAETCTGASASCPADGFQSSGTECRAAVDVCDAAETCTGTSASCPADGFQSSATVCRAAAGVCDVAENCTGSTAACPVDTLKAQGTLCRAAAGDCDVAETCTGSTAACPTDLLVQQGTECRAAVDVCDVAEACTGSAAFCPADSFAAQGTECRPAASECDVAEACTGDTPMCPADVTNCGDDGGIDGPPCECSGTGPEGPVTVACGESACGVDHIRYSCSADGWTYTGEACIGNTDGGTDTGVCECSGAGPEGPVTVSCGESACGADHIRYSCSADGWSYTGEACVGNTDAGVCQCSGTGAGGVPLTVDCGQTACGSDFYSYTCTAGGWVGPGEACDCSCSGTGPGGTPVTVYCGQSACGSDYILYSCSDSGWSSTGQGCTGPDAGDCECTGTGVGGEPVTVSCGDSACGSDYVLYSCGVDGWSWTGQACGTCECTGTGPGGVPVTVGCGQSACGSDYTLYACINRAWSWTGQACGAPRLLFP